MHARYNTYLYMSINAHKLEKVKTGDFILEVMVV